VIPKLATASAIAAAERDVTQNANRREAVKKLFTLYAIAGRRMYSTWYAMLSYLRGGLDVSHVPNAIYPGDIGCYTMALGTTGFRTLKTVHSMGSGTGVASGFGKLGQFGLEQPVLKGLADLSVTYFNNSFRDLIAFVGGSPSFENVQKAKAEGVELAGRVRAGHGLTVAGTYMFLNTKVLENDIGGTELPVGASLVRRPKNSGSLTIDQIWNRLHATLTVNFVGDRQDLDFRTFPAPRVTVPGYTTVDLAASYLLLKDRLHLRELTLFGKILNLFDEKYEQVFGFSTPGTTFLLGLKGSL
jgi:hypothetical protein